MVRCSWCLGNEIYIKYHDEEWGKPVHDDRKLFELFMLETVQAGLSWLTVLKKREGYRKAFDGFDPVKIAAYNDKKLVELMNDPDIIKNKLKIEAFVHNSRKYLENFGDYNSFNNFLWQFVGGKPKINSFKTIQELPAVTLEAQEMSAAFKKLGFKFAGPTICYALMQSAGMVNDHIQDCFRYLEVMTKEGERVK